MSHLSAQRLHAALRRPVSVRTAAIAVAGALVVAATGTAVALALTSLGVDRVSLFSGRTDASHFAVDAFDPKVKGLHRVDVTVVLENTDANGHAANVTVHLLSVAGDALEEASVDTGPVAGGDTWRHTFSFTAAGLATGYHSALLIVDDTA